jgi:hypothetical protein
MTMLRNPRRGNKNLAKKIMTTCEDCLSTIGNIVTSKNTTKYNIVRREAICIALVDARGSLDRRSARRVDDGIALLLLEVVSAVEQRLQICEYFVQHHHRL